MTTRWLGQDPGSYLSLSDIEEYRLKSNSAPYFWDLRPYSEEIESIKEERSGERSVELVGILDQSSK